MEVGTNGAIYGHGGLEEAIAVAAADVSQAGGGGFDGTEVVEAFSSDGNRRGFFDTDGNPFTPGKFSSTGGIVVNKPDVTAADGVTTTTPGFENFFGTSAAAPHAAAIAALMKQADPTLTPSEVKTILTTTAQDIEAPGFDENSGFGLIDAFAAVDAVVDEPVDGDIIYVSSTSSGMVDGILFRDEDILRYDIATDTWSRHFDGSDVGIGNRDVDAFHVADDGNSSTLDTI